MAKNKRKSKWKTIFISLVFIGIAGLCVFNFRTIGRWIYKAKKAYFIYFIKDKNWTPPAVEFPIHYSIFGIDVSHYQGVIDWEKLHAKNEIGDSIPFHFVIIKATEGAMIADPAHDDYWEDARSSKAVLGAYHYFLPNVSVAKQFKNFTANSNLRKGDLPPIIDIEETRGCPKKQLVDSLKIMVKKLHSHYKKKPIIYSNITFIRDFLMDDFSAYPFWIAHYEQPDIAPPKNCNWIFWQFTDKGKGFCTKECIDINAFYGTKSQLKEMTL